MSDQADPAVVRLAPGERWQMGLPRGGVGGYLWTVRDVSDASVVDVQLAPGADDPDDRRAVGRARQMMAKVAGRAPGVAIIELTLARPWEPDPIDRRIIRVVVSPDAATSANPPQPAD